MRCSQESRARRVSEGSVKVQHGKGGLVRSRFQKYVFPSTFGQSNSIWHPQQCTL
ncbi:MAG: hypothetical protein EBQ67_04060 [Sphingobacteriia bacterium]|nr:hypothetical protein [Sphingobacteriia bacterium]